MKNKMRFGHQVTSGASEFLKALESGRPIEERFTVRSVELNLKPVNFSPAEIKGLREQLKVSQGVLAMILGAPLRTVQSWEQGARIPSPIANRFMDEIQRSPDFWISRLREALGERKKGEKNLECVKG